MDMESRLHQTERTLEKKHVFTEDLQEMSLTIHRLNKKNEKLTKERNELEREKDFLQKELKSLNVILESQQESMFFDEEKTYSPEQPMDLETSTIINNPEKVQEMIRLNRSQTTNLMKFENENDKFKAKIKELTTALEEERRFVENLKSEINEERRKREVQDEEILRLRNDRTSGLESLRASLAKNVFPKEE